MVGLAARLRRLVIDPGPRAIRGTDCGTVDFDKATRASYWCTGNQIATAAAYPKSFPEFSFSQMYTPVGDIDSLGALAYCGVSPPGGAGPGAWSITDVAPMVRAHFGAG